MLLLLALQKAACMFYTIRDKDVSNLAFTITGQNVGFSKYDPRSDEQQVEIKNGRLIKNDKVVCVSAVSSEVRLCSSTTPIIYEFSLLDSNGTFKLQTRGTHVLAIGDFNEATQMYNAIVIDENDRNSCKRKHWFFINTHANHEY